MASESEDDGYVPSAAATEEEQQDLPSDGSLILATLGATLLLVGIIYFLYYYSSRLRTLRACDILHSASRELTADSFELADTTNELTLSGDTDSGIGDRGADAGGYRVKGRRRKRRPPSRALDEHGDEDDSTTSGAERRRRGACVDDTALLSPSEDKAETGSLV